MITETNECMSCAVPGYPCVGDSCPYRHVKHYICDKCNEEIDIEWTKLFDVDGEHVCEDCLLEMFPRVRAEDE